MPRQYFVVAIVDAGADHPAQYIAPDNGRRYSTPHATLEHIREIVAEGFFSVDTIENAPQGIPPLIVIPVARVIQWHIAEVQP